MFKVSVMAAAELHVPVLVDEVLCYLNCSSPGIYVDATLGDGGHAEAICRCLGPQGRLIGIDWDDSALQRAGERLAPYAAKVKLIHDNYINLRSILASLGLEKVDGILLDLGVSTLQLLEPSRGFSYHYSEPLDMRMDPRLPLKASDLVNGLPAAELERIFYRYGEERWARRIAAAIVRHRSRYGPIETSGELVEIIKAAIPAAGRRSGGHPARRTFQALRIAVNRELENIETVLPEAVRCLAPGGRLCVIAYHSLEDRLVKHFMRDLSHRCTCPPQLPCTCGKAGELVVLTRRAVIPTEAEVQRNPRSRSARLRAAEKAGQK
ncbi:MAG TPA: 16S rRNA (cytosine(1402)-N(4))-methyltransferase RsmH [Bacillota bacterium]|nr:16S rRNA (cytosine(1402)-N(4))-methyltransferase RsmH [Bacillota bacterium]